MTDTQAEAQHVVVIQGTGFFSKGSCTACEWRANGHADELRRAWAKEHGGEVPVSPDIVISARRKIGEPTGILDVDLIEQRIIQHLATRVMLGAESFLFVAIGLAEARNILLPPELPRESAQKYCVDLLARISHLPRRDVAKLRIETNDRYVQQRILENS